MIFADRDDAGRALAEQVAQRLAAGTGPDRPMVLALPRGGVPVAAPVAEIIGGDLDVVIARKIGAPGRPEFGVGAIAEDGPPVFDDTALHYLGITTDDLADTIAQERAELTRRVHRYRRDQAAPQVADRSVVLVDDGLATGVTAHAALRWLHTQQPRHLMLAVPVCSSQAHDALATAVDTIVCLHTPERFDAVGQWYADFTQVTDDEVEQTLTRAHRSTVRRP